MLLGAGLKVLSKELFSALLLLAAPAPSEGEGKDSLGFPVPARKAYRVEVPLRILNYGALAWSVVVGAPLLWTLLGIHPLQ
jgi:hypothetical protein